LSILRIVYNVSPFHPLAKYPGPLLWRATRLAASWHHAHGDLYKCIAAIHTKYGPTVRIAPDELSFSDPDAWPAIYNSRPQLPKTEFHFGRADERKLPESMIMASDSEHTRLRRLANPAFLNAGILEVEPVMQHYVDLLCTQLHEACAEGPQNMVQWFLWTLNDVIGQLALDQEFECLAKRRMHSWPQFLLHGLKSIAIFNQFRRYGISEKMLLPLLTKKQIAERDNFLNEATRAVSARLAREEQEKTSGEIGKKRPDIVGLMLREMKDGNRLTEPEVTANSVLIIGGGAETTSSCLSGTFYHLLKTPRALKRLRDEIRGAFGSPDDISIKATSNLPYLKATVDEGLRIFPIASYISPRITPKGGHMIAGNFIPGGVSPYSPFHSTKFNDVLADAFHANRPQSQWASGTWAAQVDFSTTPPNSAPSAGWTSWAQRVPRV
jgi:aspirochlorine biosynthesis cytochrome P450 monooxygenase